MSMEVKINHETQNEQHEDIKIKDLRNLLRLKPECEAIKYIIVRDI